MAPGQDDFFRYFCRDRGSFCYSTLSVYAAVCRGDFISDDRIYGWTSVLYGNLADFVKIPDKKDAQQAVSVGAQGLYHGACHSFLYSKDLKKNLYELYKQIFFILQAKYFVKYNEYISSKNELFSKLDGTEKELMNICLNREKILNYNEKETESAYNMLIEFCSQQIKSL